MRYDFRIFRFFVPSIVLRTASESVHLTFDDGPHPVATPKVLDVLRERKLKATFFLLGRNCRKHPDLVRRIIAEGHSIGNHSYDHACLSFKGLDYVCSEIQKTEEAIGEITGNGTHFFRPPYGCFNWRIAGAAEELNLICVLWDTDSKDFRKGSPESVRRRILRQYRKGSILLFHDNELTADRIESYLPQALDFLLQKGTTFTPLPL
jgi:peptidoglycan/xylan/chitin deacetylase (PgdA/CDA1 family)